jgi:hypothetical protein
MSVDTEFDFSGAYGSQVAQEAARSQGMRFDRPDYFKLDGSPAAVAAGKNSTIVRFLTDHVPVASNPVPWITVNMHSMVRTKAKPADYPEGRQWPTTMSAVCRKDKIFASKGWECVIDSMKKSDGKAQRPSPRTWALAVIREQVTGTQDMVETGQIPPHMVGQIVGTRDKTKEVAILGDDDKPIEGQTKIVPDVVIVQQAWKTFFSILSGFAGVHHTVLDRDYYIARNGTDQSTTYQIVALDPIMRPDGSKYDLRDPEIMAAKYPNLPDLRTFIVDNASDDFYATFFDPNKTAPPRATGANSTAKAAPGAGAQPQAPVAPTVTSSEPNPAALEALRARVQGYGTAQPAAQPAAPAAAPAAQEAPQQDGTPAAPQAPVEAPAAPAPAMSGPVALD